VGGATQRHSLSTCHPNGAPVAVEEDAAAMAKLLLVCVVIKSCKAIVGAVGLIVGEEEEQAQELAVDTSRCRHVRRWEKIYYKTATQTTNGTTLHPTTSYNAIATDSSHEASIFDHIRRKHVGFLHLRPPHALRWPPPPPPSPTVRSPLQPTITTTTSAPPPPSPLLPPL